MVNENTSLQDLFDIVVRTLDDVKPGESFTVRELFRGFEWNRIQKGNRTKLGSMVLAYSKNETGSSVLLALNKTPQNQQIYKKL